jgi:hypothetical protein
VAAATAALLTWLARHRILGGDWVDALAVTALISLVTLPHLEYDYLLLLPAAVAGLRRRGWARVAVLGPCAALWFGWYVGEVVVGAYRPSGVLESMALLAVVFVALVRGRPVEPALDDPPPVRHAALQS